MPAQVVRGHLALLGSAEPCEPQQALGRRLDQIGDRMAGGPCVFAGVDENAALLTQNPSFSLEVHSKPAIAGGPIVLHWLLPCRGPIQLFSCNDGKALRSGRPLRILRWCGYGSPFKAASRIMSGCICLKQTRGAG